MRPWGHACAQLQLHCLGLKRFHLNDSWRDIQLSFVFLSAFTKLSWRLCSSVSVILLVLNSFVVVSKIGLAPVDSVACIVSPHRLCHYEYEGLASHYAGYSVVVPSWLTRGSIIFTSRWIQVYMCSWYRSAYFLTLVSNSSGNHNLNKLQDTKNLRFQC